MMVKSGGFSFPAIKKKGVELSVEFGALDGIMALGVCIFTFIGAVVHPVGTYFQMGVTCFLGDPAFQTIFFLLPLPPLLPLLPPPPVSTWKSQKEPFLETTVEWRSRYWLEA